jgi:antitoxin ParD1/3/4
MRTQKISISLPKSLYDFIERYQDIYHCKSRSEVIDEALRLLQQKQLEGFYKEVNKEIDISFDSTSLDGLDNETW